MKKIVLLASLFIAGKMYKIGDEVEVSEREAKELIARGVATDEQTEAKAYDEKKPIEKMNKAELLSYAQELNLEVDDSFTKAEIAEAINAYLEDEE